MNYIIMAQLEQGDVLQLDLGKVNDRELARNIVTSARRKVYLEGEQFLRTYGKPTAIYHHRGSLGRTSIWYENKVKKTRAKSN